MNAMFEVVEVNDQDGIVAVEINTKFVGQLGYVLRQGKSPAAFALGAIFGQVDRVMNHGAPISEMTHEGEPTVTTYVDANGKEFNLHGDDETDEQAEPANECDEMFEPAATAPAGDAVTAE